MDDPIYFEPTVVPSPPKKAVPGSSDLGVSKDVDKAEPSADETKQEDEDENELEDIAARRRRHNLDELSAVNLCE